MSNESGFEKDYKVSKKGNAYTVLQYPIGVQKMLVEHFISENKQDEKMQTETVIESDWLVKSMRNM